MLPNDLIHRVVFHPEAERERTELLPRERAATDHAIEKLRAMGRRLGYPHSSQVKGHEHLRELRPRQGASRWRAYYWQIDDVFVIAAIGPEAIADPRGFRRAVARAEQRLEEIDATRVGVASGLETAAQRRERGRGGEDRKRRKGR